MVLGEIETARLELHLALSKRSLVGWVEKWADTLLLDAEALATGGSQFTDSQIDGVAQGAYDGVAVRAKDVADRLDKALAGIVAAKPSLSSEIGSISEIVSDLREL